MSDRLRDFQQGWARFLWGCDWILLQLRMRLRYLAVSIVVCSLVFPRLGWNIGVSSVVIGSNLDLDLSTQLFRSVGAGISVDPAILVGGFGAMGVYRYWGRTEYQLRHHLYDDIILVPLKHSGDRYGDPSGSRQAVQFEMDRSVLVLGETGSGKTEAIKVLAHQLQADLDEAFVIFDHKQDYDPFFTSEYVIRLSSTNSDVFWNVFREIEDDNDCDEIAEAVFAETKTETDNNYLTNAAIQVFADILRLFRKKDIDQSSTNKDLILFLEQIGVDHLRDLLAEEDLSAQKYLMTGEKASNNIISILEEQVKAVFSGDLARQGSFSVREYMRNPCGRILVLDVPIQQSSPMHPIFRLLIDWSIRCGLDDEHGSYYILDEFAALPELDMLERLINTGKEYNCYAILGVRAIPQLRTTYGPDGADSLLSGLTQEVHLSVGQGSVEYCRNRLDRNLGENIVEGDDEGEEALRNLGVSRGVIHTRTGGQWGRLYLFNDIKGKLLPTNHHGFHGRIAARLWSRQEQKQSRLAIEPAADATDSTPQLEEES